VGIGDTPVRLRRPPSPGTKCRSVDTNEIYDDTGAPGEPGIQETGPY
jgi:hypothetical protein